MRSSIGPLVVSGILLAACSQAPAPAAGTPAPLTIEKDPASGPSRLTLSERAAERLGIKTTVVVTTTVAGARLAIPYAAVIYEPNGSTWTYTNPKGLTFVRAPIKVAAIDGQTALLSSGPPAGVAVVTIGNAELYGAESGISGGH